MSTISASARAGARELRYQVRSRPGLRVVTGRPGQSTRGAAFAVMCAVLLGAGLMALLVLNTALGQGSYALHDLESTSGQLADTQQALTQALETQQSPAALAARAAGMGMVPAGSAAFLRLSDGAVVGVAAKATRGDGFTVVTDTQPPPVTPTPAVTTPAAAKTAAAKTAAKVAAAKTAAHKAKATKPGTTTGARATAPATTAPKKKATR